MLLEDILMFFVVGEGMCLRFMELIQLEVNFWIFNDPRWYLRQDGFMDIIYRNGRFFKNRLHTESKWSNRFFFWDEIQSVFWIKMQSYAGLDGEELSLV